MTVSTKVRRAKEETLVAKLSEQVVTTNRILTENIERVENFEIELFVSVNPLAFTHSDGRPILSEGIQNVLVADKRGFRKLES